VAHRAAIASERAAAIYHAAILLEQVADDVDNWTVFGLYSR
jgi:prephenate dehydratase